MVIDEKQRYANMPHIMVCGQMLQIVIQCFLPDGSMCYGIATCSTPTSCISKHLG